MTGSTPARDRQIDHWRCAEGAPLRALVAQVLDMLERHETDHGLRQRKRKGADMQRWERLVEVVICELALAVLDPPQTGRVVIPLRYRNQPLRYREPAFGECLPTLLGHLAVLGLISLRIGQSQKTDATTAAPTARLASMVAVRDLHLSDFGRLVERGDPVVLTRTKKERGVRQNVRIDYRDTPETDAARQEVARLNAFLAASDLDFLDDGLGLVDASDRWMSRRFKVRDGQEPRFDQCGRVFGGFWQNLKKARRANIRLQGEPVVEVDFSAAFPRIALAEQGIAPPRDEDLYAIPGLGFLARQQVKLAVNTLANMAPGARRWPPLCDDGGDDPANVTFPNGCSPAKVRAALFAHHPALETTFSGDAGYRLMFRESQILLHAMAVLDEREVPVLPMHDAVLAPLSRAAEVAEVLESASFAVLGHIIPAKAKTPAISEMNVRDQYSLSAA